MPNVASLDTRTLACDVPWSRRFEFEVNASRYLLCEAREANGVDGRVLHDGAAEQVLASFMHTDGAAELRRFYADEAGEGSTHRLSDHQVLKWYGRELGSSGTGQPRLVLIERDFFAGSSSASVAGPSEAQGLVKAVSARGDKDLTHRGRVYRLAVGSDHDRLKDRHLFEAVPPAEAKTLLTEMSAEPTRSAESRAVLVKAASLAVAGPRATPAEQIVLLRRQRLSERAQLTPAPAATPSQLNRTKQTEWVEVRFVDDAGQPIANEPYQVTLTDGSVREGSLDGNGIAYLAGIVQGICEVRFPGFKPRIAS
jgi:hypothetical protein